MEKQGEQGRHGRVVLVPAPLQGHMTPMLHLGAALHSKGFSITVIHTNFNSPDPSNHPDFAFHALSDNLTDEDLYNGVSLAEVLNDISKAEFEEHLAHMMEIQEPNNRVLGIIYDSIMYFHEAFESTDLKLPSFIFRSSSASYLHAYLAIPRLQKEGYIPVQVSRLDELVPELYPLRFKDLPISDESFEDRVDLLPNSRGKRSTTPAIIWNTSDYLDHASLLKLQLQHHFHVPMFLVGPLHKLGSAGSTSFLEENHNCIKWLDRQPPHSVIYVSLGSVATMDKKELVETACGLANSDQPFLWVVRPGSVLSPDEHWFELLPEGVIEKTLERGCIVSWAPQKKVLAHNAVGGFWSHCGWNSCLEGISEGVPMICRPCFSDQKVNARYSSHVWKVGLELKPDLERGEIASAIRRLMVGQEGKDIRQRALVMKEKINACVQEGGSSYTSLNDLAGFLTSYGPE